MGSQLHQQLRLPFYQGGQAPNNQNDVFLEADLPQDETQPLSGDDLLQEISKKLAFLQEQNLTSPIDISIEARSNAYHIKLHTDRINLLNQTST